MAKTWREVERARDRFLTEGSLAPDVALSAIVHASWKRSRELHVDATRPLPPYRREQDETTLLRVATPILNQMADALVNEPVVIILTDRHGTVLDRRGGDPQLHRQLEQVLLEPGFTYAEAAMGTNGIGTALESGGATLITGSEHFAESLTGFACAGAPIKHPVNGQLLGVLDMTSLVDACNPLLMAFAKVSAQRISQAILENASVLERALLDEYYLMSQHSGRPVIALGNRVTMMNDQALLKFNSTDQVALLDNVRGAAGSRVQRTAVADLPSGLSARLTYRPTFAADQLAGVVVQVQELSASARTTPHHVPSRLSLPRAVGTSERWQRVLQLVCDVARDREWTILGGEPGVGKTALVQAVTQHLNPERRLRVVTCAEDSGDDLITAVADGLESASLLIRRVDLLPEPALSEVAAMLMEVHDLDPADKPWVTATVTERSDGDEPRPSKVLPLFSRSVQVPPLRQHLEDLPDLVTHLLGTLGYPSLSFTNEALQQLMRLTWPGNVRQLHQVLEEIAQQRRRGQVKLMDLPPECRSSTHRRLSAMESLERDAFVRALDDHGGDKSAAAQALGVSRATVYRKIRLYGIS